MTPRVMPAPTPIKAPTPAPNTSFRHSSLSYSRPVARYPEARPIWAPVQKPSKPYATMEGVSSLAHDCAGLRAFAKEIAKTRPSAGASRPDLDISYSDAEGSNTVAWRPKLTSPRPACGAGGHRLSIWAEEDCLARPASFRRSFPASHAALRCVHDAVRRKWRRHA